jgi:hypothetical protein
MAKGNVKNGHGARGDAVLHAPMGDMLLDFLREVGVWPATRDPWDPDDEAPLPPGFDAATQALVEYIRTAPGWLELYPDVTFRSGRLGLNDPVWGVFSGEALSNLLGTADYPWHKRGPLWYSSRMSINGRYDGPVMFLRDGWLGVDPDDPAQFVVNSWDDFLAHRMSLNGNRILLGDIGMVEPKVTLCHANARPWSTASMAVAAAVLSRLQPVAEASVGEMVIRHPTIEPWTPVLLHSMLDRIDGGESAAVRDGLRLPEEWEAAAVDSCKDLAAFRRLLPGRQVDRAIMAPIPHQVLSREACNAICERIRRDRIIPVWRPPEIENAFQPFHKWKKVCWYVPWVILGNLMSGPMCVELQGLSIADGDGEFSLIIDVDQIDAVPALDTEAFALTVSSFGPFGKEDSRWRSWRFNAYNAEEDEQEDEQEFVSIFEFQPDPDAGFHLEIARAILEVQWPVIERHRNSSIIIHRSDDPEWRPFDTLQEVVAWATAGGTAPVPVPNETARTESTADRMTNAAALAAELMVRVLLESHVDMTVRELLGWVEAKRRGPQVVDRLETVLHAAGFEDVALIRQAALDEIIRFDLSGARRL